VVDRNCLCDWRVFYDDSGRNSTSGPLNGIEPVQVQRKEGPMSIAKPEQHESPSSEQPTPYGSEAIAGPTPYEPKQTRGGLPDSQMASFGGIGPSSDASTFPHY